MERVRLAFSPDSDDLFMFWPLLHGKVDPEGLVFEHERADTEALNLAADRGDLDVVAISIVRYAWLRERYLLLPHGASVGRGYGPVLVARGAESSRPTHGASALAELEGRRIGVPGLHTTAYVTLRLLLPIFEPVVVPIAPFERVFEAIASGEVDAALLIHEGRLVYEQAGLSVVADLGEAWSALTRGLPLPLGGNAIRRSLGPERIAQVSRLCRASIAWALAHRDQVMAALLSAESREGVHLSRALLDRYLAMYANADTLDFAPDAKLAVDELLRRGGQAGLLPVGARAEYAP